MSWGLEAVYKMEIIDENKAVYSYSGDDFSFPYDREKSVIHLNRILPHIMLNGVLFITQNKSSAK